MAVVKMSKMFLVGVNAYKDDILNALHKTGRVELFATSEIADTFAVPNESVKADLIQKHDRVCSNIDFFMERVEKCKAEPFYPKDFDQKIQIVSYDEFVKAPSYQEKVDKVCSGLEDIKKQLAESKSLVVQNNTLISQLKPYTDVLEPFSAFKDTKRTNVILGSIKAENEQQLLNALLEVEYTTAKVLARSLETIICVVSVKENFDTINQILSENGFNRCPLTFDKVAKDEIDRLEKENIVLQREEKEIDKKVCAYSNEIFTLKVYADYNKFLIEKAKASEEFKNTKSTFVLEAYLPSEDENLVKDAVESVTSAVFIDFSEPTKEDNPPILLKNKNPVKQTEFVTDMYSAPDYREIDPNKVVFFFFMLFMGVIMADVGYGILMILAGAFLASKIKIDNGAKRLWNVICLSGIFAIIFGMLFNSYFGLALPYSAVLPSPVPKNGDTSGLMTILLMCLGLGVLHMGTGYFLKALNGFRSKDVLGGILDGLTWVTFLLGLVFATFNFLVNYLMPEVYLTMNESIKNFFDIMTMPGIIMIGASVFIAMIGAGRNEKGFGKFTKGFGSVYGIINILSDILSYARLFGLMLSGMIIASTFNDMGLGLMSGGIGYVLGPIVMVIGHVFNVAMGVLGAYIHNSRLQYIEFFGKFYTGEGEKFKPIGSNLDFIHVKN